MPFITLEDKIIPYQMRRSQRAKRLRIELVQNRIDMVVPHRMSNQEALGFFFSKKKWIAKHWTNRQEKKTLSAIWPSRWEKGAQLFFLGKKLTIDILEKDINKTQILRHENLLQLIVPTKSPPFCEAQIRAMVVYYLKQKAQIRLKEAIHRYCPPLGRWPNGYKLKQAKRRWGSCGINNCVYINWLLILAPEGTLEYVVVHELSHLFYRNHGSRFWQLVGKIMPDYEMHERWLKEHGTIELPP